MFFKRLFKVLLTSVTLVLVIFAVISLISDQKISIPFTEEVSRSSLTDLPGVDGPVLVVKLDDTTFAHPQVGLRSADIVYIEQVEGGLTRLAALYSTSIPAKIGPVRSARISDIELLAQYGKVGFAYSGAQKLMLPVIAAANLYDVGANKFGPKFYSNDPLRSAPYAMMVKAQDLLVEAKTRGMSLATASPMGWSFGEADPKRTLIEKAHISWPASSYDAQWSSQENRWLLFHNGEIDSDETGYVLGPSTFVIQIVSITNSIYHDKVGGITPFSATVGQGKCYLLRDGGYLPCLWNRPSEESVTTFTDLQGQEITFSRGQIWFALTSQEPIFTPKSLQDATTSTNK